VEQTQPGRTGQWHEDGRVPKEGMRRRNGLRLDEGWKGWKGWEGWEMADLGKAMVAMGERPWERRTGPACDLPCQRSHHRPSPGCVVTDSREGVGSR